MCESLNTKNTYIIALAKFGAIPPTPGWSWPKPRKERSK